LPIDLAADGNELVSKHDQLVIDAEFQRLLYRKPDEFFALVESLCPGNKLEMFQQEPRENWQGWGARHLSSSRSTQ
jgi:N6-adenosine-specific RNA methylase IME4